MEPVTKLYYESHVTVDAAAGGEALERVREICRLYRFRLASVSKEDTGGSEHICTARGSIYKDIETRTLDLVRACKAMKVRVRRYKIEDTLVDSKVDDVAKLLTGEAAA